MPCVGDNSTWGSARAQYRSLGTRYGLGTRPSRFGNWYSASGLATVLGRSLGAKAGSPLQGVPGCLIGIGRLEIGIHGAGVTQMPRGTTPRDEGCSGQCEHAPPGGGIRTSWTRCPILAKPRTLVCVWHAGTRKCFRSFNLAKDLLESAVVATICPNFLEMIGRRAKVPRPSDPKKMTSFRRITKIDRASLIKGSLEAMGAWKPSGKFEQGKCGSHGSLEAIGQV